MEFNRLRLQVGVHGVWKVWSLSVSGWHIILSSALFFLITQYLFFFSSPGNSVLFKLKHIGFVCYYITIYNKHDNYNRIQGVGQHSQSLFE